jgi:hypothetical protein
MYIPQKSLFRSATDQLTHSFVPDEINPRKIVNSKCTESKWNCEHDGSVCPPTQVSKLLIVSHSISLLSLAVSSEIHPSGVLSEKEREGRVPIHDIDMSCTPGATNKGKRTIRTCACL